MALGDLPSHRWPVHDGTLCRPKGSAHREGAGALRSGLAVCRARPGGGEGEEAPSQQPLGALPCMSLWALQRCAVAAS